MDLGSSICTPKKPACVLSPLSGDSVSRARGDQETNPRKAPKKTGALRRGAAFVVTRGDELLVRTRAEKGLLGGMTEVPGSDWLAAQDDKSALRQAPPLQSIARWHRKADVVTHVFTHFPLELVVYTAKLPARARAPAGMRFVPIATLEEEALPNVMRKAIAHGAWANKIARYSKSGRGTMPGNHQRNSSTRKRCPRRRAIRMSPRSTRAPWSIWRARCPATRRGKLVGRGQSRERRSSRFTPISRLRSRPCRRQPWRISIKLTTFSASAEVDHASVPKLRAIRSRYLNAENPPASTLVYVTRLAQPGWLVEVEVVAAIEG